MLNYLRAEFYKVFHRKSFYVFTGVLCALAVFVNVLLCFNGGYGDVECFNAILADGLMNLIVPAYLVLLFADWTMGEENKYGTLKNAVSMGVRREVIYVSKFLVTVTVSFIIAACILLAFYGSGWLLFATGGGVDTVMGAALVRSILCALSLWIACISISICLNHILHSNLLSAFASFGVISLMEFLFRLLELIWKGFEVLRPYTILNQLMQLPCIAMGDPGVGPTAALVGCIYTMVFFALGLIFCRRREVR